MTVQFDTYRPRYRLDRMGGVWRIIDPQGQVLSTPYNSQAEAQERRDSLQREADQRAKRGLRPCMCCRQPFESEGIHNRLCGQCRERANTDWMTVGGTSTGKVRRAAS